MTTRGLLLDVDGTLLDSNGAHAAAFSHALAGEGVEVATDRLRPLIGMGSDNVLARVGVDPKSPLAARVVRQKREIFETEFLRTLHPTRGARDLLDHARARGLRLVVATSASAEELSMLLRAAGIADLIDGQGTSNDAKRSKPAPDIVEAAIVQAKLDRRDLVMLGDTPYDVQAAAGAGVPILAVRCGGWADGDLAGAAAIYEDPLDILAGYEASLLA